jgi:hypothetical protein
MHAVRWLALFALVGCSSAMDPTEAVEDEPSLEAIAQRAGYAGGPFARANPDGADGKPALSADEYFNGTTFRGGPRGASFFILQKADAVVGKPVFDYMKDKLKAKSIWHISNTVECFKMVQTPPGPGAPASINKLHYELLYDREQYDKKALQKTPCPESPTKEWVQKQLAKATWDKVWPGVR